MSKLVASGGLNRHGNKSHWILSPDCLPIPARGHKSLLQPLFINYLNINTNVLFNYFINKRIYIFS